MYPYDLRIGESSLKGLLAEPQKRSPGWKNNKGIIFLKQLTQVSLNFAEKTELINDKKIAYLRRLHQRCVGYILLQIGYKPLR